MQLDSKSPKNSNAIFGRFYLIAVWWVGLL